MVLSTLLQNCMVFSLPQNHMALSFPTLNRMVLSYSLQNRVALHLSTCFRTSWSSLSMAAAHRLKSQLPSSFAAPFQTPPTVSYTCQHPRILPAFLSCHSKSGQVWPHGLEPIFSKISRRLCNQGSCFTVTSWVEVTPISLAQSMATAI